MSLQTTSREHQRENTQPYGRIITVITPLITLTCIMSIVSYQLLQLTIVQANNNNQPTTISGTLAPLLEQSQRIGSADPHQQVSLSIGLRPRNPQVLQQLLRPLLHPHTGQPRHVISTETYIGLFSPEQNTYATLKQSIRQAGFQHLHTYQHRLLLDFSGTIEQAEQFFHVTINTYRAPDGHVFYANRQAPLLPQALATMISSINGLNDATMWAHTAITPVLPQPQQVQSPQACPAKQKSTADIATLHDLSLPHDAGNGQTIALFELAPVQMSDLDAYQTCLEQHRTTLEIIQAAGSQTSLQTPEAEADAELLLHQTPELDVLKIYSTGNNEKNYLDQWAQILMDAPAIVATNWGLCESLASTQLIQQEQIFFQFAALQGQSILASSSTPRASCPTGVTDPAAQPFVTGVGTSSLAITDVFYGQTQPYTGNEKPIPAPPTAEGGISRNWTMPVWQQIQGIPNQGLSSSQPCVQPSSDLYCREVPDVSFNADTTQSDWIYCTHIRTCTAQHPWISSKRTATALLSWAAFIALTNHMSQQQGGTKLGFLNPLLYQLANDPVIYATSFHDSATHKNYSQCAQNCYAPIVGYDMASGLGSYHALTLAHHLLAYTRP